MSLLASHPNIETYGEYFRRLNGKSYQDMINYVFSPKPRKIRAVGFKVFYNHPYDAHSDDFWNYLANINGLKIIHLKRKNFLQTFVSRQIASITNEWFLREKKVYDKKIRLTINPKELQNSYTKYQDLQKRRISLFDSRQILEIIYEEMIVDLDSQFHTIARFLSVPFIMPKSNLIKQNTRALREIIENYDELKSYFENTELSVFFNE
jgi:LPS sulfotransferase NodH